MPPKEEAEALPTLGATVAPEGGSEVNPSKVPPMQVALPGFGHVNPKDITPPRLIHFVEPKFTEIARRKKISGICVLSLVVDTNGRPTHIGVIQAVDPGLGFEAVKAVAQYRFSPAMYQSRAVPLLIHVEVNFRIY
jgi:TonB family protein